MSAECIEVIESEGAGRYFCFDHGKAYTDEQMICPECERELGETYLPVEEIEGERQN